MSKCIDICRIVCQKYIDDFKHHAQRYKLQRMFQLDSERIKKQAKRFRLAVSGPANFTAKYAWKM